mgnify:CR=1 FL=1
MALSIACLGGPTLATGSADLSVSVNGLRNTKGNVLICVTANPREFPDCSKDSGAQRLVISAAKLKSAPVAVRLTTPGRYAVSLVHDENANGKLDKLLLVPREGYGFSRNPRISFGPPKFSEASFQFDSTPLEQDVEVKYSL